MKPIDEKELCLTCVFNENGECYNPKCKYQKIYQQCRIDTINEYKDKLIKRLLPHLNDLAFYFMRESEVYKAITEIAEQIKGE